MDIASSTTFIATVAGSIGVGVLIIMGVTVGFGFAVYLINWGINNLRGATNGGYYQPQYGDALERKAFSRGMSMNRRDGIDLS